jgi:hypothetical protein
MTMRAYFVALFLAILVIGVQAQFSNVGVSGTVAPAATEKSSAIKEALADSIRLRAEAHKEKVLAKYGEDEATQAQARAAKTKSFAYTKIHIPGSTP